MIYLGDNDNQDLEVRVEKRKNKKEKDLKKDINTRIIIEIDNTREKINIMIAIGIKTEVRRKTKKSIRKTGKDLVPDKNTLLIDSYIN